MNLLVNRHYRFAPLLMLFLTAAMLLFAVASTASARTLTTDAVKPADIQGGTYSLIAHGCNSAEDLAPVAILQREDTPYHFGVVAPRGETQTIAGLTRDEALRRAQDFVNCNPSVLQRADITEIRGPNDTLVGYEVKPVYYPLRSGSSDGVHTSYRVKGDTILTYVYPDPLLQGNQMGGG